MTYTVKQRKNSYFLITILVASILVSIPIISNHFFHPEHYFHVAIHESGFILAIFLVGITIISYRETKLPRMLFSSAAFVVLAISQLVYMIEKINIPSTMEMEDAIQGHFDIGILIMTVIFAVGIFYKRH
jgi:amino acid transporter